MAFYGYNGDASKCYWTPYNTSSFDLYDVAPPPLDYSVFDPPPQSSLEFFSADEFNEPRLSEFSPYGYFDSYSSTESAQNYYACNLSESRFIQYNPPPTYAVDTFDSQTRYTISYSNANSNSEDIIPEFEEYDPTPYGGGYDPVKTYGKPLPPSDEICYPRSSVKPKTESELLDGFSFGSLPAAYGGKSEDPQKSQPVAPEEQNLPGEKIVKPEAETKPAAPPEEEDSQKQTTDKGTENVGIGNGSLSADGFGELNRQVPYVPYGSGLESLDLCESIFGYWPCLAKMERQRKACHVCDVEESSYDPWKSTSDYLFGSPFPYGEMEKGGNESHYQHQNLYRDYQY